MSAWASQRPVQTCLPVETLLSLQFTFLPEAPFCKFTTFHQTPATGSKAILILHQQEITLRREKVPFWLKSEGTLFSEPLLLAQLPENELPSGREQLVNLRLEFPFEGPNRGCNSVPPGPGFHARVVHSMPGPVRSQASKGTMGTTENLNFVHVLPVQPAKSLTGLMPVASCLTAYETISPPHTPPHLS